MDGTNRARLRPGWVSRTGKAQGATPVTFEATPIMAKGRLYICTGRNEVIAIDAESGRSLRRYDARPDATGLPVATCRGVAYYKEADSTGWCAEHLHTVTITPTPPGLESYTGHLFPR